MRTPEQIVLTLMSTASKLLIGLGVCLASQAIYAQSGQPGDCGESNCMSCFGNPYTCTTEDDEGECVDPGTCTDVTCGCYNFQHDLEIFCKCVH